MQVIFCPVSSDSSLDTFSSALPSSPAASSSAVPSSLTTSTSLSSQTEGSAGRRSQQWPAHFPIPTFSYYVELRLRQGNEAFRESGALLSISRDMKSEIRLKLVETMYSFTTYPTLEHFGCVAKALVEKHPCLTEPGSTSKWYGWKHRRGKRNKVKKPRWSETNFLPDLTQG